MLIFHAINGIVDKIMVVARFRLHNNRSRGTLLNYELADVVIFRVGLEIVQCGTNLANNISGFVVCTILNFN